MSGFKPMSPDNSNSPRKHEEHEKKPGDMLCHLRNLRRHEPPLNYC